MKCKTKTCDNDAATRGVCWACYSACRTLVKKGESTWERLEELGFVDPVKKSGRKSGTSKVAQRFSDLKDD